MTATKLIWGPGSNQNIVTYNAALGNTPLNDADNAAGWTFNVPTDGTITEVGFLITARTGTPPAYNVGLVTLDANGRPTTTVYGGSAITAYTPPSTGWKWVTLSTSATVVAGEYAAVHIYPAGTAPDGSNYIRVCNGEVAHGGNGVYYTTLWLSINGGIPMAVKYSDGSIHGFALSSTTAHLSINSGSTPDELGCKFTVPAAMTVHGLCFYAMGAALAGVFDVVLYAADDTVLATTSVADKDFEDDLSIHTIYFDPVTLAAGTVYRAVVKPTSASAVILMRHSFESEEAKKMFPCGADWQGTSRTNAGAWTDVATDIVPMALIVSTITLATTVAGEYAYIG